MKKINKIIQNQENKDKEYFICGYSNPNFNKKAVVNVKPVKVVLKSASEYYKISNMEHDYLLPVTIKKNGKLGCRLNVSEKYHHIFETEDKCIKHYNKLIENCLQDFYDEYYYICGHIEKNTIW